MLDIIFNFCVAKIRKNRNGQQPIVSPKKMPSTLPPFPPQKKKISFDSTYLSTLVIILLYQKKTKTSLPLFLSFDFGHLSILLEKKTSIPKHPFELSSPNSSTRRWKLRILSWYCKTLGYHTHLVRVDVLLKFSMFLIVGIIVCNILECIGKHYF